MAGYDIRVATSADLEMVLRHRRRMFEDMGFTRAEVSSLNLHASDGGRALYESLGFAPTNEMRIDLRSS
jgi:hypothetical protein